MLEYFPRLGLRVCVAGAAGFVGSHLARELKSQGHYVVGVDWVLPEHMAAEDFCDEFLLRDLRTFEACRQAVDGCDHVFQLAADMGGMGWLGTNQATSLLNNALINLNMLEASRQCGVRRYFFSSSACAYPEHLQTSEHAQGLREADAWPAAPQDAYGLEKLFSEEACRHYAADFGMATRVARFHNVYGPKGTWKGGREKSPAALCRKVAAAAAAPDHSGTLEIWGDGRQTRSYVFIDDLVDGVLRLAACDDPRVVGRPVNLGTDHLVSIDELADLAMDVAGKRLQKVFVPGPQGVRGRNSDNALMRDVLQWEPRTPLRDGMAALYSWVALQVGRDQLKGHDTGKYATSVVADTEPPAPLGS
jgi:GDP-D-mannose 3',5'-epimerase